VSSVLIELWVPGSYLEYLQDLEKRVDEDWPAVAESLEAIRTALLAWKDAIVNLTADDRTLIRAESHVATLLDTLPAHISGLVSWDQQLPSINEGLVIPTQVNYVGKAVSLYDAGYELNGSAYVISKFIGNTWLWDQVRVSGGAYGGFCDFDSHSGVFSFLSYRDPNLVKTLDNYDGTVEFPQNLQLCDDALTKAIIGTIVDVDSYQLPVAKGYTRMLHYIIGITDDERQCRHDQILSTSVKDFHMFADVLETVREKGVIVAVASAVDIAAANEERPGLLQVKKVL
jgi:Zn-dependent M16 (insulinase) family peptidase